MKKTDELNNNWRKVASSIYRKPTDSKIFGFVEVDITELEEFISDRRRNGVKITLTHIFVLAVARALKKEVPELNAFVRRGRVIGREHVDALVSVLLKDQQMGSVKIPDADTLTLSELAEIMHGNIFEARTGDENKTMKMKAKISALPWPVRNWAIRLFKLITIDWGLSLRFLGLDAGQFGSFVVSNIGSIGLDMGFPALLPTSNVAMVFIIGEAGKKPVAINDQVVIRKILKLGATLDHRLVDASHGGKLFRYLKYIIKNPKELEVKPVYEPVPPEKSSSILR